MNWNIAETQRRHASASLSRRSSLTALGAALASGLFAPRSISAMDEEGKQQCQGHREECEAAVREVCSAEGVHAADCLAAVCPCCDHFADGNIGEGLRCFLRQWLTPIAIEEVPVPSQACPVTVSTPGSGTGTVTIQAFSCPAELSQSAGQGQLDQTELVAACTLLASSELAPTLSTLPASEPQPGTVIEPGVYRWEALEYGDYAVGRSGDMPENLGGLLVTDADGEALQNPALRVDATSPHVELHYFYFIGEGTPVP